MAFQTDLEYISRNFQEISRTNIEWGTSTFKPVMSLPRISGLSPVAASALESI
jgi:hypothetical protein